MNKRNIKSAMLFTRTDHETMDMFTAEVRARGVERCEALRMIVNAWIRNPEIIPIGLPPERRKEAKNKDES